MRCYLFDLDGTLSNPSHRLHHIQKTPKDWNAFFDACGTDPAHDHIVGLALALQASGEPLVFVTGRALRCRLQTEQWLLRQGLAGTIYMRADGDHRPDDVVKSEMLDRLLADGYQPIMAFDDRDRVVAMWRARGVPCAQMAPGDF